MKRRKAIRNLAIASAGMALMPACSAIDSGPVYSNFTLEPDLGKLLTLVTEAILPKRGLDIQTPETTTEFVLLMINDCMEPEERQEYLIGLRVFRQFVRDKYEQPFSALNPEQHLLLFNEIEESELLPECLPFFLNTTKQLTIRHFASSEFFMKEYLDFEFVPGRYLGCVEVS